MEKTYKNNLILDIEKEKINTKLLYLFDYNFVYNEGITDLFKNNILFKIFGSILNKIKKFLYVSILILLIIMTTIEVDIFILISKVLFKRTFKDVNDLRKHKTDTNAEESSEYSTSLEEKLDITVNQIKNNDSMYRDFNVIKNKKFNSKIEDIFKDDQKTIDNLKKTNKFNIFLDHIISFYENKKKKETDPKKMGEILSEIKYYRDVYNVFIGETTFVREILSLKFPFKSLYNILSERAERVQKYVYNLLNIIFLKFKTVQNNSLFIKNELKKINIFTENYFKNNSNEDHLFLNESFSLPFSKDSSPGNVIKITYKLDDQHKINVNSITGVAEIIGANPIEKWKKIGFTSTDGTYKWKKNEWKIIKNFIENSKLNNNVNNKDNVETDNGKINDETNDSKNNNDEVSDSKNNNDETDNNEVNNTKVNDDETDSAKDSNNEINNGKTSDFFSKMIKGVNSDTFKYLIIGLIICTAIAGTVLTGGLSAGFSGGADLASQGVEAINNTFSLELTTQQVAKWLGFAFIGGSIASPLLIDKYVQNMSKPDVEKSMETANKSGFLSFITNLIKKIMQKIGLKKKEETQKEINDSFINKKIYDKKTYNEQYLMSEYFKIENKLRKKPVF